MYRILFFVLLFAVLIPLVWKLVNKIFFKVSVELKQEPNASDVIDEFIKQKKKLEDKNVSLKNEVNKSEEEIGKLNSFQNKSNKE